MRSLFMSEPTHTPASPAPTRQANEYIRSGQRVALEAVAVDRSAGLPGLSKLWPAAGTPPPVGERRAALWGVLGEPAEGAAEGLELATAAVRFWLRSAGGTTTAAEVAAIVAAMLQALVT